MERNPTFEEAVELFAAAWGVKWSTPVGAWRQCGTATASFLTFLKFYRVPVEMAVAELIARNVRMEPLILKSIFGDKLRIGQPGETHVVARIGDVFYDWTLRQYQPEAALPHIATREELLAAGWELALVDGEA